MKITRNVPKAKYYHDFPIPKGARILGTIKTDDNREGALMRLRFGQYIQVNAGHYTILNQQEVKKTLRKEF